MATIAKRIEVYTEMGWRGPYGGLPLEAPTELDQVLAEVGYRHTVPRCGCYTRDGSLCWHIFPFRHYWTEMGWQLHGKRLYEACLQYIPEKVRLVEAEIEPLYEDAHQYVAVTPKKGKRRIWLSTKNAYVSSSTL